MYKTVMLAKDLVAASSKPLVLSILAGGESYGYEIIQKVRELSGGHIEWSAGCCILFCTGWNATA